MGVVVESTYRISVASSPHRSMAPAVHCSYYYFSFSTVYTAKEKGWEVADDLVEI